MKRTTARSHFRKGQRGTLRCEAPPSLNGAPVELVRVNIGTLTVRMLETRGAYRAGDELVVNQYEFQVASPPEATP